MADLDQLSSAAAQDDAAAVAERRLARGVAIGLPAATVAGFVVVAVLYGMAPGILVLVAGVMLGAITLFWASLRVLSGDAPLSPEIEALDAGAHAVDQLAVRKRMLLRALKDLDNERALGKLDAEDHEALASTYRNELKDVLRRMDEGLAPYRKKAEELAASFLAGKGLEGSAAAKVEVAAEAAPAAPARQVCSACQASNEPDARFCKACGKGLPGTGEPTETKDEERAHDES